VAVELLATNAYMQFETAAVTLQRYTSNIIRDPNEPKYRRIRLDNSTFDRNVRQTRGGIRFLEAIGFLEINGFLELEQPSEVDAVQEALSLLALKVEQMKLAEQAKIDAERAKVQATRQLKDDAKRDRLAMICA